MGYGGRVSSFLSLKYDLSQEDTRAPFTPAELSLGSIQTVGPGGKESEIALPKADLFDTGQWAPAGTMPSSISPRAQFGMNTWIWMGPLYFGHIGYSLPYSFLKIVHTHF